MSIAAILHQDHVVLKEFLIALDEEGCVPLDAVILARHCEARRAEAISRARDRLCNLGSEIASATLGTLPRNDDCMKWYPPDEERQLHQWVIIRYNKNMRKFHFVDFAAHFQKGFRNHVVSVTKVPELIESFGHYSCFSTYFFFSDEILTYMSTRALDSKPTISGYEGKVWAPYFPMDIDHSDFGAAVRAARFLASFFLDEWKVEPNALQIYFSGSKGFHLMLDTRVFGKVTPSKALPLIFSAMRRHLAHELPENLDQAIDLSIKDRVRLLRLPNTVHEKSNLRKVLMSREELDTLNQKAIFDLAQEARPLSATDETGLLWRSKVTENPEAARFFKRIRRQVRQITKKPFEYHFRHPEDLSQLVFPCAGVQTIWQSHVDPGYRNNCAIRLASEFRLLGLSEEETRQKLFEWSEQNQIGLPEEELVSVIRSAYQHPFPYRYGCHDEILRHFCPLESYEACQTHVARQPRNAS